MNRHDLSCVRRLGALVAGILLAVAPGCGKASRSEGDVKLAETPAEAATQVEEAFSTSEPMVKDNASAAAEAVRTGNYEKAVVALQSLKERPDATLQQGLAVHGYLVNLEAQLINAAAAGDPKAQRAYEMLKAMKRK